MSDRVECPQCDGGREPWYCDLCHKTGFVTPPMRDHWHAKRREAEARLQKQGRAVSSEQKRAIVERLYEAWTNGDARHLRLGQLLANATWSGGQSLHLIEDEALAKAVDAFAEGKRK